MIYKIIAIVAVILTVKITELHGQDTSRIRLTFDCSEGDVECFAYVQSLLASVAAELNITLQLDDYDECAFSDRGNCSIFAACNNAVGSYNCTCLSGFIDEDPSNPGRNCSDIDECLSGIDDCLEAPDKGLCNNVNGSFECACLLGYQGDGRTSCTDINECADGSHNCFSDDICVNTPGSFECACAAGYTGDGVTCTNIDECESVACADFLNTECVDNDGSFSCPCLSGYVEVNGLCEDVNECNTSSSVCQENQDCYNTAGSFYCLCKEGYRLSVFGTFCIDINECASGSSTCEPPTFCQNTDGSYNCACPDGVNCTEVDECANPTLNTCHANATCSDTTFHYKCSCKPGFTGDGRACIDIDECNMLAGGINDCDARANCINSFGSFSCQCQDGYEGDGRNCRDVDECRDQTSYGCDSTAECTNTPGHFSCECVAGYAGDGRNCTEIDECSPLPCLYGGTCQDLINDFACMCPTGFSGTRCQSVFYTISFTILQQNFTPALLNTSSFQYQELSAQITQHITDLLANTSANLDTIVSVRLSEGSIRVNVVVSIDASNGLPNADALANEINSAADFLKFEDPKPQYVLTDLVNGTRCHPNPCVNGICMVTDNFYKCVCSNGYTGERCEFRTDCSSGCHPDASCIFNDTSLTSVCVCNFGFTGDGISCNRSDCSSGCHPDASCIFNDTSLTSVCVCNFGFTGDGISCNRSDCSSGCHPDASCIFNDTSLTSVCVCNFGFTGDGISCNRSDCSNGCHPDASCIFNDTSLTSVCVCNFGFTGDGISCNRSDCSSGCHPDASCIFNDTSLTSVCVCNFGFTGDGISCNRSDCSSGCHPDASCIFNDTSLTSVCVCNFGFTGDGISCNKSCPQICIPPVIIPPPPPPLDVIIPVFIPPPMPPPPPICTETQPIIPTIIPPPPPPFFAQVFPIIPPIMPPPPMWLFEEDYQATIILPPMTLPPPPPPDFEMEQTSTPPPPMMLPPPPPPDFEMEQTSTPPPPMMLPPPPPPDFEMEQTSTPPPPMMLPPPPPPDFEMEQTSTPPPPMMLPPPPPPDFEMEQTSTPPPPMMLPPPPPPDFEMFQTTTPPPPMMLPPPPPPDFEMEQTSTPPPPMMLPPPPPPDFEMEQTTTPPPPMMLPPPPPPDFEMEQTSTPPPPMMLPPPPPPDFEMEQTSTPPPPMMLPPPPPPDFEMEQTSTPPPPPMMLPPPPPPDFEMEQTSTPPPPMMLPPPPPPDFEMEQTSTPPPPMMLPPPPPPDFEMKQTSTPPLPMIPPPPPPPEFEVEQTRQPPPPMISPPPPPPEFAEECTDGYVWDSDTCSCIVAAICNSTANTCADDEICVEKPNNTFVCDCFNGYKKIGQNCSDIDECVVEVPPCGTNEMCENTDGNFTCLCERGYERVEGVCEDIDECVGTNNVCGMNENCENTIGNFTCNCVLGYGRASNGQCEDINECLENNTCVDGSEKCNNTLGSYMCICATGYAVLDGTCTDIDECGDNNLNDCHANANCTNNPGGYTCTCDCGYSDFGNTDNGTDCVLDHCKYGGHDCSHSCVLLRDGFECVCDEGFEMDESFNCIPVFPCASFCDGGVCYVDVENNTACRCNNGYESQPGSPSSCQRINECDGSNNMCEHTCNNGEFSSTCQCNPGYAPAVHAPLFCCEPAMSVCDGARCSGNGDCTDDFTTVRRYKCNCFSGWIGQDCSEDVNECIDDGTSTEVCVDFDCTTMLITRCENQGLCQNTPGNYSCNCPPEWTGRYCETDVDECKDELNKCNAQASCVNNPGSYSCLCNDGYATPVDGPYDGTVCVESSLLPFGAEYGDILLNYTINPYNGYSELFDSDVGFLMEEQRYNRLYVTDNGAFILKSAGNALTQSFYDNTGEGLTTGTTRYNEAIVAAYWANLDISTDDFGEIFYQFYKRSDHTTHGDQILNSVSTTIQNAFSSDPAIASFNASETLKLTYSNVPYFSSRFSALLGNKIGLTFQAFLTTDGVRTFLLSTYTYMDIQNFFQFPTWVGYADPYSSYVHPVSEGSNRLRPDLYFDPVSNKTGVVIMQLNKPTNVTTASAEASCQEWYDAQPDPDTWLLNEICPSTYNHYSNGPPGFFRALPIYPNSPGATVFPFQNVVNNSVIQELRSWTGQYCIQPSFPQGLGSGTTCCYDEITGAFLSGGYPNKGGHYSRNLLYFRSAPPTIEYLVNDVRPGIECCVNSVDPRWCDLYIEKRPATTNEGYQPLLPAAIYGDPHLVTLDGIAYSYSGIGEFILMQINNGDTISVQVRMSQNRDINGNLVNASVITSVAVIDRESSAVFQFDLANSTTGNFANLTIFINQSQIMADQITTLQSGLPIVFGSASLSNIGSGVRLMFTISSRIVYFNIEARRTSLSVISATSVGFYGQISGLYGKTDGNQTNDFRLRNGTTLDLESLQFQTISPVSSVADDRFNTYIPVGSVLSSRVLEFGESWRTNANESLFVYAAGDSWSTINDLSFPSETLETLLTKATNESLNQAASACTFDGAISPQCLHDVLISNDPSRAQAPLNLGDTLTNLPPMFDVNSITIRPIVNQAFTLQLVASDPENDTFIFRLGGAIASDSSASLSESGLFMWTPNSMNVTNIMFYVTDANNLTSAIRVVIELCACANNGNCDLVNKAVTDNNNQFYVGSCQCSPGYGGTYCNEDVDGCASASCFTNVTCTDRPAPNVGFDCGACPDGYVGDDGILCLRNYCATGGCSQQCGNFIDRAICRCNAGYNLNTDGVTCVDINECDSMTCEGESTCKNTNGSFVCECNSGFIKNTAGRCVDFNECTSGSNLCDNVSTECFNLLGTYRCNCKIDTFTSTSSNTSCADIDECSNSTLNTCVGPRFVCNNTIGGYRCDCGDGYQPGSTAGVCDDVNECLTNPCAPSPIGLCSNFDGSYSCSCVSGYTYNNMNKTCDDVDECLANGGRGQCSHNCTNNLGSFECSCMKGYQIASNNRDCVDVDECTTGSRCQQQCTNNMGSYDCTCYDGFYKVNNTCIANMTCPTADASRCVNADCFVNASVPTCICLNGYTAVNETVCDDIDECNGNNSCHAQASCTNTPGSFDCTCNMHYVDVSGEGISGITCRELASPIASDVQDSNIKLNYATVQWGPVTFGEQFRIYLTINGGTARLQENTLSLSTLEYTFYGLSPDTNYTFNIMTVHGSVVSTTSTKAFQTKPNLVPPSINAVNVNSDVTSSSIRLTWTLPPANVPVDRFRVTYSPAGGANVNLNFSAATTETSLTSLTPSTLYTISIVTAFDVNISSTNTITQYTAPNPPSNASVSSGAMYGDVTVMWTGPTSGAVDDYMVTVSPAGPTFVMDAPGSTTGVVSNLSPGTTYELTIVSVFMNITSTSVQVSATVAVTTQAPTIATTEQSTADTATTPAVSTTTPITCPISMSNVNGVCLPSQIFVVELTFSDTFVPVLNDPAHPVTISFVTRYTSVLNTISGAVGVFVVEIVGITFRLGSTIVSSTSRMANVTNRTATTSAMMGVINGGTIPSLTNNNLTNAVVMDYNECLQNISDCSSFATCVNVDPHPGYTCTCNGGYRDKNPSNPGRTCEEQCTLDGSPYCMNGGVCTPALNSDSPHCACTQWYTGSRCDSTMTTPVSTTTVTTPVSTTTVTTPVSTTTVATPVSTTTVTTPVSTTTVTTPVSTTTVATPVSTTTVATPVSTTTVTTSASTTTVTTLASTAPPINCPTSMSNVNGVCLPSQIFFVELTFSDTFDPVLNDPTHPITISFVARYTSVLNTISGAVGVFVVEIVGITFRAGSTIVSSTSRMANVTNRTATTSAMMGVINGGTIPSLTNNSLVSAAVMDYNECLQNISDCSSFATCVNVDPHPGYTCTCNGGYRDKNPSNPGRTCEEQCTLDGSPYCMNGGVCTPALNSDSPHCACTQWYTGSRCDSNNSELIGLIVGISLAIVILIVVVAVLIYKCCYRGGHCGGYSRWSSSHRNRCLDCCSLQKEDEGHSHLAV